MGRSLGAKGLAVRIRHLRRGEGSAGGDSVKLVLILLAETIASREEIPASLLVHLPHVGLLGLGDGEEKVGHIFKHLILIGAFY